MKTNKQFQVTSMNGKTIRSITQFSKNAILFVFTDDTQVQINGQVDWQEDGMLTSELCIFPID